MSGRYDEIHRRSLADPDAFWGEAAEHIHWFRRWDRVLDHDRPPFTRWFVGGETNIAYNALDRHVAAGRGDQAALLYESPVTNTELRLTYRQLRDRVVIYMPMVPEAVVAMLACVRLGAIHSVVFGGFAANELATRIDDARPKLIVSASCGIEGQKVIPYKPLLDAAIDKASHKPDACIILQRSMETAALKPGRDIDWQEAVAAAKPADCVPVKATDPSYILYTSGTTGIPKGVVRDTAGHMVALRWSMENIYAMKPGEVWWTASDVGWVVGHSYIVYAPLLHGLTTILYEGKPVGTPDAAAFWRVIAKHGAVALFTAPTAFRAIRKEDPEGSLIGQHDLSEFRTLFLAGERCDPNTLEWAEEKLGVPVIDHWWQTETGWPICANCMGIERFPVKPGSATKPVPGWNVQVVDAHAQPVKRGEIGALVMKLPLPPGSLQTLWHNDAGFEKSYMSDYPGHYKTGDAGYIDEDGYVFVMSRTDDIINVAGHRLSTGAMEEVLARHPDVAECAVIGVADVLKGQLPLGMMVLKAGVSRPHEEIAREVVQMVREAIGPVAAFKTALVVDRLPKTRSGKILRGTMQKIADGESYRMPATIDDPAILSEIGGRLNDAGYPQKE